MAGCCFSKEKLEPKEEEKDKLIDLPDEYERYSSVIKMTESQDFMGFAKEQQVQDEEESKEEDDHNCEHNNGEFQINQALFVHEKSNNIYDDYDIEKRIIGQGGYGFVKFGTHNKSGQKRAIKFINNTSDVNKEELIKEIEILKQIDHPNVMRVYEYYQDDEFFYIVSEICTGGEVFDKILEKIEKNLYFTEQEVANIMR